MAADVVDNAPNGPQEDRIPSRRLSRSMVEKEMADCDEEMLSLQARLKEMKHRRHALKEKLNNTSPMSILPLDIIVEIFSMVYENQDKKKKGVLPAPFVLGSICKVWRHVVFSTPRLWCTIMIRFSPGHWQVQEDLLKEWILRSANHPLHLYLDGPFEPPRPLFELLLSTSTRWKTFDSFAFWGLSTAMKTREYSFPLLTFLRLHGFPPFYDGRLRYDCDFSRTPQLRHIDISESMSMDLHINREQLKTLAAPFTIKECVTRLNSYENLRNLDLKLSGRPSELSDWATQAPYAMPNLKRLELDANEKLVATFLSIITTPALRQLGLYVSSMTKEISWLHNAVDLQRRSATSLEELAITEAFIPEQSLVDALTSLPTLTSLHLGPLKSFSLSDVTISAFNPNNRLQADSNNPFLPELTTFRYRGAIKFQPKSMTSMLENRLQSQVVKPIRSMDIEYGNAQWGQMSGGWNPNILQDFYRQIVNLASRGTTLNLVWDERAPSTWP